MQNCSGINLSLVKNNIKLVAYLRIFRADGQRDPQDKSRSSENENGGPIGAAVCKFDYSHSMVPGGFEVMS